MSELLTGIPFSDYLKLPGLSQSVLKLMDTHEPYGLSPLHAKAVHDGTLTKPDSKAKRFGRAEHAWILEGESAFREQFVVMPDGCCAELKSGQRKGERCNVTPSLVDRDGNWFCGKHRRDWMTEPDNSISAADVARIEAMAAAVKSSDINVHLSRPGGSSEATILYDVEVSTAIQVCPMCEGEPRKRGFEDWACKCGAEFPAPKALPVQVTLPMKARLDRLLQPYKRFGHAIIDVKRHGEQWGEEEFKRSIWKYGYAIQCSMYCEAVAVHYGVEYESVDSIWIAIEPTYPHDIIWILASDDDKRIGRHLLNQYREKWAMCSHLKRWPGTQDGISNAGGLPSWVVKKHAGN